MVTSVILVTVLLLAVSSSLVSGDLDLHIFALPVGQGDATVIKCPDKPDTKPGYYKPDTGKLNIIDIGSSSCSIMGGYMDKFDIRKFIGNNKVENIFLTHPDKDHYNLLPALTDKYLHSTVNVYYSHMAKCYQQYGNKILEKFLGMATSKTIINNEPVGEIGCNDPSKVIPICDDDATITIIASELGHRCKCPNVDSLVLQLEYKGKTMLFVGDLEGKGVDELLACHKKKTKTISSNVLRLSHHGSRSNKANSDDFLDAVFTKVNYAISSSDPDHKKFHHPSCEILKWFNKWFGLDDITLAHDYVCDGKYSKIRQPLYQTTTKDKDKVLHYILQLTISKSGYWKELEQREFEWPTKTPTLESLVYACSEG